MKAQHITDTLGIIAIIMWVTLGIYGLLHTTGLVEFPCNIFMKGVTISALITIILGFNNLCKTVTNNTINLFKSGYNAILKNSKRISKFLKKSLFVLLGVAGLSLTANAISKTKQEMVERVSNAAEFTISNLFKIIPNHTTYSSYTIDEYNYEIITIYHSLYTVFDKEHDEITSNVPTTITICQDVNAEESPRFIIDYAGVATLKLLDNGEYPEWHKYMTMAELKDNVDKIRKDAYNYFNPGGYVPN